MLPDVGALANGRWSGILSALGVDSGLLTGAQKPCPMCGGKDRFRFDDKEGRGTWICNKCGAGDGFKLLMMMRGTSFPDTKKDVLALCGTVQVQNRARRHWTDEQRRIALRQLWKGSVAISRGDQVDMYLRARGIALSTFREELRFVPDCPVSKVPGVRTLPAMIAMMRDPKGVPVTIHRTYIKDGEKADIESPRRLMPGPIADGSVVRLGAGRTIGVAEGIETALAASLMFGFPVWAALNATLLKKFEPPSGEHAPDEIVVFADHDANFAGQAAAFELGRRLCERFRVSVEAPGFSIDRSFEGSDYNDLILQREIAA